MPKPTMTVTELEQDMRACGISTSAMKIRAFIKQGLYPFAIGMDMPSGNCECEIYRKLYEDWKKERGM